MIDSNTEQTLILIFYTCVLAILIPGCYAAFLEAREHRSRFNLISFAAMITLTAVFIGVTAKYFANQ